MRDWYGCPFALALNLKACSRFSGTLMLINLLGEWLPAWAILRNCSKNSTICSGVRFWQYSRYSSVKYCTGLFMGFFPMPLCRRDLEALRSFSSFVLNQLSREFLA